MRIYLNVMVTNRMMKKLESYKSKYDSVIGEVESSLSDKILFDFSVFYQPSDGFVVLNYDTSANAPLNSCLDWIRSNGELSESDHEGLSL